MVLVLADRVKETTTTAGTGTVTLLGASVGFQSFAVIGTGSTTYYCIAGQTGSEWEVGIGTYTLSGTTLARTTVLANSAGTQPTALTFSSGTKDVFITYPAERAVGQNGVAVISTYQSAAPADGIVMDYTTGMGRISVFAADGIAFYANGIGNATLLTLNASGAMGVGPTPTYGTSGQVLVSAGTAAPPAWTTSTAASKGFSYAMGLITGI